jgi:hypothetical protein
MSATRRCCAAIGSIERGREIAPPGRHGSSFTGIALAKSDLALCISDAVRLRPFDNGRFIGSTRLR